MLTNLRSLLNYIPMNLQDTELYCRNRRYERFKTEGAYIYRVKAHSLMHRILIRLLRISRLFEHRKLIIVDDKRKKNNKRPIIFASTHIGGADIETAFEAIKTPCWLLLGDPRDIYRNFTGFLLDLNGVICFDTLHKQDRIIAKERMANLIRKRGNILMYPEGAWNIFPEILVMHLYAGAVRLAIECGALIVPLAILRDKNQYYVSIGEEIDYAGCSVEESVPLTNLLRDIMATMKWNLMEIAPSINHENLSDAYYKAFLNEIFADQSTTYSIQDVYDTIFVPNNHVPYEEVFEHLTELSISRDNAFLLNKRLH